MILPDKEMLLSAFDYDPNTGVLIFKKRTPDMFKPSKKRNAEHQCNLFNATFEGKVAGSKSVEGYISLRFNRQIYKAHRVIWKIMTGIEPENIDHINRDPSDNRWGNLRSVSHAENCRNRRTQSNSRTGVTGVFPRKSGGYRAVIQKDGRRINLGTHSCVEQAYEARRLAEIEISFSQLGEATQ